MRGKILAAAAPLAMIAALAAGSSAAMAAPPSEIVENGKSAGDVMIRVRGIVIQPHESATIDAIGGDVDVSTELVPEVDFSLFLTDNLALELIAATAKHDVEAEGTALGDLDLGSVWHLPPTLLLQWHIMPKGVVSPYFGAGVNYTLFYNEDEGNDIDKIEYDNSWGYALQTGVDIQVANNLYLNLDVKKIWIETDVEINDAVDAEVDIDPWVFGVGLGYKF